MTQLGADPDHLRGLARSLRAAAGRLDTLSLELARRLRATDWRGPDAASFTRQWDSTHRPALTAAAGALTEVARRSEHHAEQQERASGDGPAAPRAAPVTPVLAPLPRREERFLGAIDVRVGPAVGTVTGELTVQHLEGDRRRVVLTQSGGAGAMLGAGSSVDVAVGGPAGAGGAGSGGSADGRATAGAVLRRSWELPADRVEDLLTRLALEQLALGTVRVPDPLTRAGWLADEVIERLTGDESSLEMVAALSAGVPTPARTERLAEVELTGAATLGVGSLLGGRAAGVTGLRVGRSDGGAAPAWIVEYRGASTGALTGRLLRQLGISLPPDAHRSLSVRIEVPDPPGDAAPSTVLVRVGTVTDTTTRDLVALVELGETDTSSRAALGGAVAALGRGDPGAALGALGELAPRPEHVTLAAEHGVLSGHTARAGATAGAGVGAGITVRGHVLEVDRPG
jgi:hypothetical protein